MITDDQAIKAAALREAALTLATSDTEAVLLLTRAAASMVLHMHGEKAAVLIGHATDVVAELPRLGDAPRGSRADRRALLARIG